MDNEKLLSLLDEIADSAGTLLRRAESLKLEIQFECGNNRRAENVKSILLYADDLKDSVDELKKATGEGGDGNDK